MKTIIILIALIIKPQTGWVKVHVAGEFSDGDLAVGFFNRGFYEYYRRKPSEVSTCPPVMRAIP